MNDHERERVVALDPDLWLGCDACHDELDGRRKVGAPRFTSRWVSPADVEGRLCRLEVEVKGEEGRDAGEDSTQIWLHVHGSANLVGPREGFAQDFLRWKLGLPLKLEPGAHTLPLLAMPLVRSPNHVVLDVVWGRVVSARVALSPLHL